MQKPLRIAIAGCQGRMGRALLEALSLQSELCLGAALEQQGSSVIGQSLGKIGDLDASAIRIQCDLAAVVEDFDVLIDFTRPEATLNYLEICRQYQKAIVIGTTGFSDAEKEQLAIAANEIPVVFAANYSVGVNLLLKLLEQASAVMGDYCDIEIVEAHHRHKVDAPSGTALAMGEAITAELGRDLKDCAVYGREGICGARTQKEIGFSVVRAGDIVGEHTAIFADIGERVEITHKASSRLTFANGALRAARWLSVRPNGLYSMRDVLAL